MLNCISPKSHHSNETAAEPPCPTLARTSPVIRRSNKRSFLKNSTEMSLITLLIKVHLNTITQEIWYVIITASQSPVLDAFFTSSETGYLQHDNLDKWDIFFLNYGSPANFFSFICT